MPLLHLISCLLFVGVLTLPIRPIGAATYHLSQGDDFQAALNTASPGDTLILSAGAAFTTASGFVLPNKGSTSQYITIQSSKMSVLPGPGYRVRPAHSAQMPKLVSTVNASPVIKSAPGAHHYRFIGIEVNLLPGLWSYGLVELGDGTEVTVNLLPHHIEFDRCYLHGNSTVLPGTKRGFQLNGSSLTIRNSHVEKIHVAGQDAQAIAGWNGPGPISILNNFLEASGENILFGGADPRIPNLVPSDIDIRGNYLYKPLGWMTEDAPWTVKNILELKNARRVIIEGNILENCWLDAQTGSAILLTPRNQDGTAPWSTVEDVILSHNIIRHAASGFQIMAEDNNQSSRVMQRVVIRNNLILDINPTVFGGAGRIFQITTHDRPIQDLSIEHNTGLHTGDANGFVIVGECCTVADNFRFSNNIMTQGAYGFKGDGTASGISTLNTYFTHYQFLNNVIVGSGPESDYPADNHFVPDLSDVGFDLVPGRYQLLVTSPFYRASPSHLDLGADAAAVHSLTCGVLEGLPAEKCAPIESPTNPPASLSLPEARIYPNPWRSDRNGGRTITFDQLSNVSEILIFTVSGKHVKTLRPQGQRIEWDLTTDSGRKAASGIYLYLLRAVQGRNHTGRLVIIR